MAASTQQEAFLMAPWRGMVWRTTRLGVLAFASDGAWCCTKAPGDGGRAAVSSSFGTFAVINKKGRLLSFDEPFRVVLMKTIQGGEFDAREMESVLVAGLWCTQGDWNTRPSIRQVLAVLRFELPLPCLLPVPERAPVVAYTPPAGLLMNSDPSSHGTDSTSATST